MTFLLWQREQSISLAGGRVVLRPSEVPLFEEALHVCEETARLHAEHQQRTAAALEQARVEGFARGREEGWQAARDELAAALQALADESARERSRVRNDVAALALQVVRKLMGEFADDTRLAGLALAAVQDMLPTPTLALVVHPELSDAVRTCLDGVGRATQDAGASAVARFDVRGDPAVGRDTCRIETEHGSVEAALEAQLQRLGAAWGLRESAVTA